MFQQKEQTISKPQKKKKQTADRNLSPHASVHTLTYLFTQNQVSLDQISTDPMSLTSVCHSISIILHSLQHHRKKKITAIQHKLHIKPTA